METQQREIAQLKLKLKCYEEECTMETNETACAECQTSFTEIVKEDPDKTVLMPIINSSITNRITMPVELDPEFVLEMDKLYVEQIKIRTRKMIFESDGKILAVCYTFA